jgi:hypothetical protein
MADGANTLGTSGTNKEYNRVVEAVYTTTCEACGERIREGDMIVHDEEHNVWIHEVCTDG